MIDFQIIEPEHFFMHLFVWVDPELGLADGQELAVADVTTPQTVLFKLNFTS